MKCRHATALLAVIIGSVFTAPLSAHHSISAEFDLDSQVNIAGVVTRVEWMNPHAWLFIDVKESGTSRVTNWRLQLSGLGTLEKLGWTRNTIRAGDAVAVQGSPSRDGRKSLYTTELRLAGGGRAGSAVVYRQ